MMLPGAIAILSPLIMGFLLGPEALGGFLAGATVSGVLMGMFQNNAGGAWDNAKKSFEKGVEINGEMFYKKSEPHKASVTGDTVGDPFKDTSGTFHEYPDQTDVHRFTGHCSNPCPDVFHTTDSQVKVMKIQKVQKELVYQRKIILII